MSHLFIFEAMPHSTELGIAAGEAMLAVLVGSSFLVFVIIPYCELPIGFRQWVVHSDITQLDINCRNIYVHTLMPRLKFI